MGPHPHTAISSPSPLISQITLQRSNYGTNTLSPGGQSGSAGLDEGENLESYDRSPAMIRNSPLNPEHYQPSEQQGGHPSGRVGRTTLRRGTATSEHPPPTTTDPPQPNPQMNGVFPRVGELPDDAESTSGSVGGPFGNQEEDGDCDSGHTHGGYTNRSCSSPSLSFFDQLRRIQKPHLIPKGKNTAHGVD